MIFFILPFALQALIIFFDEFYFHIKRGLPLWERIGHPLDTLSVVTCMGWILYAPYTLENLKIYCFLAIFSCIFITKDEFVHKHFCPAFENYLHAFLFILHPICLLSAGLIWPILHSSPSSKWLIDLVDKPEILSSFLHGQMVVMSLFCFYQIVYWNFVWKKKEPLRY